MEERFKTATMYVWNEDFDVSEFARKFGISEEPDEDLVVCAVNNGERKFRTKKVEERFSAYNLDVPYYEISFFAREPRVLHIDKERVRAVAGVLANVFDMDVLAVGETAIESKHLFASDRIAERLGISSIPELDD